MKLKITPIGNSFGVILPKEALAKLKVAGGDSVFITETQDGFRITPYDPEFENDMKLATSFLKNAATCSGSWLRINEVGEHRIGARASRTTIRGTRRVDGDSLLWPPCFRTEPL